FEYLICDPVALEVLPAQATDAEPVRQGLRTLPSQNRITLQDWLAANTTQLGGPSDRPITASERPIAAPQTAEGPFSPALPEQLLALGDLLQANGEAEQAQAYFERASHITRINHGLYSTEQVVAVERIIQNQLQRGNLAAADQQH